MEYIVIFERNHKEEETFLHYCQWTGNEEELGKLVKYIEKANYEELDGGDYSSIWVATNKRVPESAVDAHVGLSDPNGYAAMFQKHKGKFTCPDFEIEAGDEEEYELARALDELFYGGQSRFPKLFKK